MCIFHKWGKWYQYDVTIPEKRFSEKWALSSVIEHNQKRVCVKCGKEQRETVGTTIK